MMRHVAGIFVTFLALTAFAGDGFLGINLQVINNDGQGENDNGVIIERVIEGHGAAEAGLKAQDRIVSINGLAINNYEDLKQAMKDTHVGDSVPVSVERAGEQLEALVTLGEKPERPVKWAFEFNTERAFLGVATEELSEQLARFFKVEYGLLIENVVEGSPAAKAGLKAGDVITAIDGEPVHTVAELHSYVAGKKENDEVVVSYNREGKEGDAKAILGKTKGLAMDKFNMAPYMVQMRGLENLSELENLEHLSEIMEGLNFSIDMPELKLTLKEALGNDFQGDLQEKVRELRQQLQKLEELEKVNELKKIEKPNKDDKDNLR